MQLEDVRDEDQRLDVRKRASITSREGRNYLHVEKVKLE